MPTGLSVFREKSELPRSPSSGNYSISVPDYTSKVIIIMFMVFTLDLRAASLRRDIGAKGGGDVTEGGLGRVLAWGGGGEVFSCIMLILKALHELSVKKCFSLINRLLLLKIRYFI